MSKAEEDQRLPFSESDDEEGDEFGSAPVVSDRENFEGSPKAATPAVTGL